MAMFYLDNDSLSLVVSSLGGCVLKLAAHSAGREIPLLRPAPLNATTPAGQAGCFPLVPFGNRVSQNRFSFEGRDYVLSANTAGDRHYLHGDGWLQPWQCIEQRSDFLRLRYQHQQGPYQYQVEQCFSLVRQQLRLELTVEHRGENPMPYGLGWHPFFPLTPDTQLQAPADACWQEADEWLPGEQVPLSEEMDFNSLAAIPRRWLNNGFGGWNGQANIQWPEQGIGLQMNTEPACPVYFMFISDPAFSPGYQFEFFCLEPMTHAANGHNMPGLGGLRRLAKGERFSQTMLLSYSAI